MLSMFRVRYPDELRADFQQYYSLNIDELGDGYGVSHAAVLAAQLPMQSRTLIAHDPSCRYSTSDRLLEAIEYNTHVAWWKDTKDGQKNRHRPRPIGLQRPKKDNPDARPVDDYRDFLDKPRKEVGDGN